MLSLQEDGRKRKTVTKIELTPLSDCNISPFFKGFKKNLDGYPTYWRQDVFSACLLGQLNRPAFRGARLRPAVPIPEPVRMSPRGPVVMWRRVRRGGAVREDDHLQGWISEGRGSTWLQFRARYLIHETVASTNTLSEIIRTALIRLRAILNNAHHRDILRGTKWQLRAFFPSLK